MFAKACLTLVLLAATAASAPEQFASACTGDEILQTGDGPPRRAAYAITLSFDLARRLYCYGACGRDQTYDVRDPTAAPILLAEVDTPQQMRHTTYDRRTARLSDDQRISLGPVRVVRHARATCRPATFRPPFKP